MQWPQLRTLVRSFLSIILAGLFVTLLAYFVWLLQAKRVALRRVVHRLEEGVSRAMFMSASPRFDIAEVRYDLDGKAVEAECSIACTGGNHPVTVRYPQSIKDNNTDWLETRCSCAKPVPVGSQVIRTQDVDLERRMTGREIERSQL